MSDGFIPIGPIDPESISDDLLDEMPPPLRKMILNAKEKATKQQMSIKNDALALNELFGEDLSLTQLHKLINVFNNFVTEAPADKLHYAIGLFEGIMLGYSDSRERHGETCEDCLEKISGALKDNA